MTEEVQDSIDKAYEGITPDDSTEEKPDDVPIETSNPHFAKSPHKFDKTLITLLRTCRQVLMSECGLQTVDSDLRPAEVLDHTQLVWEIDKAIKSPVLSNSHRY